MNKIFLLLLFTCKIICFQTQLIAQPYVYYPKFIDSPYAQLYQYNFASGKEEVSISDTIRITGWLSDSYSKYVAITVRGHLFIYNSETGQETNELPKRAEELKSVLYAKNINKLFVSFNGILDEDSSNFTYVLDANTLDILFGAPVTITKWSFFNEDESLLYFYMYNAIGGKFLYSFSTQNYTIIREIPFIQIGFDAEMKLLDSGTKGKAIVSYLLPSDSNTIFAHYQLVDINTLKAYPDIPISYKSEAHLTKDTKYIIIEEVGYALNSLGNDRVRPGNVKIFDAQTGKSIRKLNLPQDGKVILFDGYPNMMYYYIQKQNRSINIDLSKLAPNTCTVKLLSSTGALLTGGSLQYRDSTWKDAANNNDGTFTINTTKKKLSLRMTYNNGTQTKSNVTIKNDSIIIFQTKNVAVNLQNSQGTPLDTGVVEYNSNSGPLGASWQNYGITSNGIVSRELLPTKYTFRMTYNCAAVNKAQSLDSNATVVFRTFPAKVQLQTSTGIPLDTGIVQFNAGGPVGAGWQPFGITTNGIATKELLPTKYNFRITYNGATVSQAQSIDSNATVIFQTVRTLVQFNNSQGTPIDTGIVQFNSGGWQNYGSTSSGIASKELLPIKYTFRLTYCGSTVSIAQNVDSNAAVVFSTVLCTVSVTNSSGSLLNNATVSYNASGWKVIGTTVNGIVIKEFLPAKIQFRAAYGSKQQSVTQDVSTNPFIAITLPVQ